MLDEKDKEIARIRLENPEANLQEMAEIYTAADVFLNLGREETMGLTTVEAMACGTPVVVSNLTAVPEVVGEGGGIVLEELTVDAIKAGIIAIITSSIITLGYSLLRFNHQSLPSPFINIKTESSFSLRGIIFTSTRLYYIFNYFSSY